MHVWVPTTQIGFRSTAGIVLILTSGNGVRGFALGDDPQQRVFFSQLADNLVVLVAAGLGGGQLLVGVGELADDLLVGTAQLDVVRLGFLKRLLGGAQFEPRFLELLSGLL